MIVEKKETYSLISTKENSIQVFYKSFEKQVDNFKNENLILELSNFINYKKEDFLLFLDVAQEKKNNGTSFVIVNAKANIEDFPDDFNIVPTIIEAEDILEMEAIERELGF